jgi:hypothetical protein
MQRAGVLYMNDDDVTRKSARAPGDMPLPLTRLIHENFALLMMYAYSQPALVRLLDAKFKGEWKYLNKALFAYPVETFTKACLELGILLRVLDDEQRLTDYLRQTKFSPLGRVFKEEGAEEPLYFRDLTNKLVHSTHFTWNLKDEMEPKLVCHSPDKERWVRAEIEMVALAAFCGMLMS